MIVPPEIIKHYVRGLSNLQTHYDQPIGNSEKQHKPTISELLAKTIKFLMISDNVLWGQTFNTGEKTNLKKRSLIPHSPIVFQGSWEDGKQWFPIREYLHLCDKYRMKIHPIAAVYVLEITRDPIWIAFALNLSADNLRESLLQLFPEYDFRPHQDFRGKLTPEVWLRYQKLNCDATGLKSLIWNYWQVADNKVRLNLVELISEEKEHLLPDKIFDDAPYSSNKLNSILAALKLRQLTLEGEVNSELLGNVLLNVGQEGKTIFHDLSIQFNCKVGELINRFILLQAPGKIFSKKDLDAIFSESDSTATNHYPLSILQSSLNNNDSETALLIFDNLKSSPLLDDFLIQISTETKTKVSAELFFNLSNFLLAQKGNRRLECFNLLSNLFPGFWPDSISTAILTRLRENERNPVEKKLAGDLFRKLATNANPLLEKKLEETINSSSLHPFSNNFQKLLESWKFRKRMRLTFDKTSNKNNS